MAKGSAMQLNNFLTTMLSSYTSFACTQIPGYMIIWAILFPIRNVIKLYFSSRVFT